ncbi:aminoglycoside phosphotransferase family protein [Alkalihalobacillus macyae]|uniref:aminoglycoside phosphotransferase family protein n=1 Tax=Guptibacillus hwajinpoensis TaxID=208199 RepID=UPI00273C2895|nr:aminoglycoside phosphotransferase family protein [Alkalihalobacillus macyae]MDP4550110.1 aminoglycoside phosphotransferase family protein [Alkalihalobacillus macyae]
MDINTDLVRRLINEQFPKLSGLDITPVKNGGNDNRTFHLGDDMSVRLPSSEHYAPQVEKEQAWLPKLAREISLPISTPIAKGYPNHEYPFPWSINKWLEGETVTRNNIRDVNQCARDLGAFLIELQSVDASGGPIAGKHNFYRGGDLAIYNQESRGAIDANKDILDTSILEDVWNLALSSKFSGKAVWVHGDMAPGNILTLDGKLSAVIDFGIIGVGDPSCDYVMAWTFFDDESRKVFKRTLNPDEETWNRARGWALWKALITYSWNRKSNKKVSAEAYNIITIIQEDYERIQ